jgi:hypothetical protein
MSGFGTLLKIGDGGGTEVFTTVAEVRNIDGPAMATDTIEITNHSSPSAVKEFIASLTDTGQITLTVNFLPTNATHNPTTGLIRDQIARNKRNFQLVFPDTAHTTWQVAAYVTAFQTHMPTADALTADVTLKVSGVPTFL